MFSRVTPRQKKFLVTTLQTRGHKVAMTGDGVNDLPAMRQADCSAAMGNGSDTAKQTAQLVLLDSDFAVLKDVISEGRRVINNLTKSAGVFFAAPHLGLSHAQMNKETDHRTNCRFSTKKERNLICSNGCKISMLNMFGTFSHALRQKDIQPR